MNVKLVIQYIYKGVVRFIQHFFSCQAHVRAGALTFYSLLAMVPVLAIAFGVAQGFGLYEGLFDFLREQVFRGHAQILEVVMGFVNNVLTQTNGGLMAFVALILLFFSGFRLMDLLESSMNAIWQVKDNRRFFRKISDYFFILVMGPLILLFVHSSGLILNAQLGQWIGSWLGQEQFVGHSVLLLLKFVALFLNGMLFCFVYLTIVNTNVRLVPALGAGFIAAILFQLLQKFYIHGQIGLSKLSAIYGSFAAFPFFLIWLNLSWILLLLGAQLAYFFQARLDRRDSEA